MTKLDTQRYVIEIRSLDGTTTAVPARWTDEECRHAIDQFMQLGSRTPTPATRLYWLQLKDESGASRLVTTWDWTDDDRQLALERITNLAEGAMQASPRD